ncbi:O-antigen ligase family protein [Desulfallas thermosapovorans]|uniref:Tfp pilus assembly protein PilF n=1 Tax=Desulfallas thermosapovorans DSM 6562 TaxID=1121431 RepID=A0A5S4ZV31_9FIRM|nr:O-antigen ligase family protein [Desulfallas thermosapovorans]TYO96585.1 Tfp pilus assembly protein PilF [Desulfallas thermosapovorans DSM 6562]
MTAKKRRIRKETVNQTVIKNNQETDWLHQIAFWGLALLLFFPPYFRGLFFAPEQEKALMLATLVFWLTFLWRWLQNDHKFLRGPLDYFALALPLVYIISSFTAVNKGLAIDEVVKNILYFLTYWSASRLIRNQEDIHKLLHVIYISAIGVALAGLATATGIVFIKDGYNVTPHAGGIISSTFQYHNALATYLGAVFFVGIYLWYQSFSKQLHTVVDGTLADSGLRRYLTQRVLTRLVEYFYACGNFLLLLVLFASKSRGGLLVFALVFAIYLLGVGSKKRLYALLMTGGLGAAAYIISGKFISLVQTENYGQGWLWIAGGILLAIAGQMLLSLIHNFVENKWIDNSKKYMVAFASLVAVVLVAGVIWISGKPGVVDKISSFEYLWTAYHRVYYMESATDMIKERPVLGWGGGGWQEAYESFLNFRYTTRQAHSYYFQTGVETGIVGLAVVLGIWISFIVQAYRLFMENINNIFRRQILWLFFAIFLMISGHAAIDFDLSLSAITIVLWSVFGMTSAMAAPGAAPGKPGPQSARQTSKYLSVATVTTAALIIFSMAGVLVQANSFAGKGYKYLNSNNLVAGIDHLEKASSCNPLNPEYRMLLSRAYVNQGNSKKAVEEAKTAVQQSKYSFNTRNNYIQVAIAAGENKLAAKENELLYELAPNNIETYEVYAQHYLNLGAQELQSGNKTDARVYLNKVLGVSDLLNRQGETLTEIDKSLWEGPLLEDTEAIYLVKGQAAYCLGMFTESLGYLQQVAQSQDPDLKGRSLLWLALIEERKGNQEEANKLIDQINQLNPQLMQNYAALKSLPVL